MHNGTPSSHEFSDHMKIKPTRKMLTRGYASTIHTRIGRFPANVDCNNFDLSPPHHPSERPKPYMWSVPPHHVATKSRIRDESRYEARPQRTPIGLRDQSDPDRNPIRLYSTCPRPLALPNDLSLDNPIDVYRLELPSPMSLKIANVRLELDEPEEALPAKLSTGSA